MWRMDFYTCLFPRVCRQALILRSHVALPVHPWRGGVQVTGGLHCNTVVRLASQLPDDCSRKYPLPLAS